MKLFIGGEMGPWPEELSKEIERQILVIHHSTEKPLEEFLAKKDYGPGLKDLGIIPIIFRPDVRLYNERTLYRVKKGDADYRLKIDYDKFVHADEKGKRALIIKNILQAIRMIGERAKKNKVEFDSEKMERDIREFLDFHEEL